MPQCGPKKELFCLNSYFAMSQVFRGASRLARARALVASAPTRGMAGPSGAGKGDRRGGFWSKWNAATQQEFAQEVAFEGDKRSERRRSPLRSVAQAAAQDPRDDYDDLELLLDDSLESVGEAIGGEGRDGGRGQAAEELEAVREALLSDDAVSARRRAELLGLLDELGPAALAAPARYPPPGSEGRREALDLDELGLDDDGGSGDLSMVSSFLDSVRLREAGALPPGGFFAHVLHTRAVSKAAHPLPRRLRDTSWTPPRHLLDSSEHLRAPPSHSRDSSQHLRAPPSTSEPLPSHSRDSCETAARHRLAHGVSQVTSGGKKRSISVLAVVGNGAGSAGFGLGKDEEATEALVKACKAARKQLLHVDRFDGRLSRTPRAACGEVAGSLAQAVSRPHHLPRHGGHVGKDQVRRPDAAGGVGHALLVAHVEDPQRLRHHRRLRQGARLQEQDQPDALHLQRASADGVRARRREQPRQAGPRHDAALLHRPGRLPPGLAAAAPGARRIYLSTRASSCPGRCVGQGAAAWGATRRAARLSQCGRVGIHNHLAVRKSEYFLVHDQTRRGERTQRLETASRESE